MSLARFIRAQLGLSNTAANNFTLDASADNGTMKLVRGNSGAGTQDILTVDASGNVNAPVGLQKAGSAVQALSDFTGTNVSLSASGYQKLPSGLIIQWGAIVSAGGSWSFPIAFPNACLSASVSFNDTSSSIMTWAQLQVTYTASQITTATGCGAGQYIAVGY